MRRETTCGQGLAAHASLPAKLGDFTAAVADVLERHTAALDLRDDNAKRELEVYRTLVERHRRTAAELHSTAKEMESHRDLPMGRHDPSLLASPAAADAFEGLVAIEEELLKLLEERIGRDREMLGEMRSVSPS